MSGTNKIAVVDATNGTPLSRKAACPCGSGRRYKNCCYAKGFHYFVEADGSIVRVVPVGDEVKTILENQRARFVQRFGREPGPDDLVFFDTPPETELRRKMIETMRRAGIRPALIYAYEKTGLMLTEENRRLMTTQDVDAFEAAVDEWHRLHGSKQ